MKQARKRAAENRKKALQLNLFEEYTVLSVSDRNKTGSQKKTEPLSPAE